MIFRKEKLLFKPLEAQDLTLLQKWFQEPHVKEFWQETTDIEVLNRKFLSEHPNQGVHSFVIYYDNAPMGYIQSYEADKVGHGWWPDAEPGTFGIDLFIGDLKMIGIGLGTVIIEEFIKKICNEFDVQKVMIDPTPENTRMIHLCEKIGFLNKGVIDTPGGKAILMELEIS